MWKKFQHFYLNNERLLSSLGLVSGFVFDIFTLKRVDLFIENFWVVVHLLMAAIGIVILNFLERRKPKEERGRPVEPTAINLHFIVLFLIQFAFGGLFSVFLVFYFRSATLSVTWPFLALLAVAFVCNERLRAHYARLSFQVAQLFLSIYAYAIFFLPIVLHRISDLVFFLSGLVSLVTIAIFLILLRFITKDHFIRSRKWLAISILGIFAVVNILYFTNLIPPLPLSLQTAGAYHSLTKDGNGDYVVTAEPTTWWDYFKVYQTFHLAPGQSLYVFTAIFSPAELNTKIVHEWQYYDPIAKKWQTKADVSLAVIGGREGGYRTYSIISDPEPGLWRLNVKLPTGAEIGQVKINVVDVATSSDVSLIQEIK